MTGRYDYTVNRSYSRRKLVGYGVAASAAVLAGPQAFAAGEPINQESPTVEWQQEKPETQGLDAATLNAGVRYAREKLPQARSLLIARHGRLILEEYFQGLDRDSLHRTASVTKSVVSLLAGIAVRRKLIPGLDAKVIDLLPSAAPLLRGTVKERMTLRHLLSMTSGLASDEKLNARIELSADPSLMYLSLPCLHEPGGVFSYDESIQIVSRILTEVTGSNAARFAETELFGPLGIRTYWWPVDYPEGVAWGSGGLRLRSRDMARLGLLFLRHGQWDGKEIVNADWITESSRAYSKGGPPVGAAYGLGWWIGEDSGRKVCFACGDGGQTIQVFPEIDMIIVTTADVGSAGMDPLNAEFILPAVQK